MLRITAYMIVVSAILFSACTKNTEQNKIRKAIRQVQHAAENKDVRAFLSRISKNYSDPRGNSYDGIKGLFLYYVLKYPKISVFIPDLEIAVQESKAEVKLQAVLSGRSQKAGGVLPESMGIYRFEVSFIKEKGDWNVISAKWQKLNE